MKANEAPEKIYLNDSMTNDTVGELYPEWFNVKVSDSSIEYTRTDAFVEKACEWLDPVLKNYAGYYVGKDILEGFKNYMKEE